MANHSPHKSSLSNKPSCAPAARIEGDPCFNWLAQHSLPLRRSIPDQIQSTITTELSTASAAANHQIFSNSVFHRLKGEPKTANYLRHKFKNKVVIDLGGAGGRFIPALAYLFEAKAYVNIDLHWHETDRQSSYQRDTFLRENQAAGARYPTLPFGDRLLPHKTQIPRHHTMQRLSIRMDMLAFLERLPDDSVPVISISGIDNCIIKTHSYQIQLLRSIRAKLVPGGVAFGCNSVIDQIVTNLHTGDGSINERFFGGEDSDRVTTRIFEKQG